MIFHFSSQMVHTLEEQGAQYADLMVDIMRHHHYALCDNGVADTLCRLVNKHGSTTQKDLLRLYRGFSVSGEQRMYLTMVDVQNYSCADLQRMAKLQALVLVENKSNEWPVYKKIIELYSQDRNWGTLFAMLSRAVAYDELDGYQGGGCTTYPALLDGFNIGGCYRQLASKKIMTVLDRDTDSKHEYDSQKNSIFNYLAGKNSQTIDVDDIYVLNQPNGWIWHMWYKRAIENYFPNEQFRRIHCDCSHVPSEPIERDYFKINGSSIPNYGKSHLPRLVEDLSLSQLEQPLMYFTTGGVNVSEMQLFLLKMIRLI